MKNNRQGQSSIMSDRERGMIRRQLKNASHRLFFDIACFTGERWGAICQLRVSDVYAKPQESIPYEQITFRASTRKASPSGERFTRQIAIHPFLHDRLSEYKLPGSSVWLFPSTNLTRPITFSGTDKWFRAAVEAAGLHERGFSTHSTRRTFITKLSEQGTDWKIIQQIVGYQDLNSLALYVEASDRSVAAALAAVS